MANFYNIPAYMRQAIKDGADFIAADGETIPNARLTKEADPSRSYAYCSDTRPVPEICEHLQGVDLLYHEATFAESEVERARLTHHSTAREAAEIARQAGAKRLAIGHFSSRYDDESTLLNEACEIFPDTVCATEGMVITI